MKNNAGGYMHAPKNLVDYVLPHFLGIYFASTFYFLGCVVVGPQGTGILPPPPLACLPRTRPLPTASPPPYALDRVFYRAPP
jgi:hypothetical protein